MTNTQFAQWSELHATLFQMRSDADATLLGLLQPVLGEFGFEELRAASYAIAADPSGRQRFRENHLAMLTEAIRAKRTEAAARDRAAFDRQCESAECPDCNGVGVVRVPSPTAIVDGELQRGTFTAVACLCGIGVARFNAINGKLTDLEDRRRLMDLREYELTVPDWRDIAAAYREKQERQFDIAQVARQADRATPIIVGRDT